MSGASARQETVVGVTVGTVGIKGAPVDLRVGQCTADRARLLTPSPATPEAVGSVVDTVVELLCRSGPVGVALPAAVRAGVVETAPALDPQWIGVDVVDLLARITGRAVAVVNDSDAAGIAEMRYGAGKDRPGVVVMITLGTGIDSALFVDGKLVPNTDLGSLPSRQQDTEDWTGESIGDELSWLHYAHRVQNYLDLVERLLWPRLIILAGAVSAKAEEFLPHLKLRTEIVPARLRGDASIIGAALAAEHARAPVSVSTRYNEDAT